MVSMKIGDTRKYTPRTNTSALKELRAVCVTEVDVENGVLKGYVVSDKEGTVLSDSASRIPVVVTLSEIAKDKAKNSANSKEGDFPYGGVIDARAKNWLHNKHKGGKAVNFPAKSRSQYFGKRIVFLQNPMQKGKFADATEDNPVEFTADWLYYVESSAPEKLFVNSPVTVHPNRLGFSNIAVYDIHGEGKGMVKAVEATPANIKKMAAFFDAKKAESVEATEQFNVFRKDAGKPLVKYPRPYAGFSLRVVKKENRTHNGLSKNGTPYSYETEYTLLANSPFYEYSKSERTEDNEYKTELIDGEFFTEKVKNFIASAEEAFSEDEFKVEIVPALLFGANVSKGKGNDEDSSDTDNDNKKSKSDEDVITSKRLQSFVQNQRGTYIQYQDEEPQERDNIHTLSQTASFVSIFPHSCEEVGNGEEVSNIIFNDNRLRVIQFRNSYNFPKPIHEAILSSEFDGNFTSQRQFALYVPKERIHNDAGVQDQEHEIPPPPEAQDKQDKPENFQDDIDDDIPF